MSDTLSTPAPAAAPCEAPAPRQFDCWLGEWDAVAPEDAPAAGKPHGRTRTDRVAAGWGLSDHWTGACGF